MILRLAWRMLTGISPRILWRTAKNLCWKGLLNIRRFEKRSRENAPFFPAFMMISLTSRCNYSCHGCWVNPGRDHELPLPVVESVIDQCRRKGSFYFGLMGGEPFLYEGLFDIFNRFPDCFFQVFTNGSFLTKEAARKLSAAANVSPVISIEGLEQESDERRGAKNVYASALEALDNSVRARLMTGVAASICRSNFDELTDRRFVKAMVGRGAHYLWYYIYRPVGTKARPDLALNVDQILKLRRFLVDIRVEFPIIVIDTYWDAGGKAVCPGAMGLSHHLNPEGYLEFCPPIQFSKEKIIDGSDFSEKISGSVFLSEMRKKTALSTRGCIIMDDPKLLHRWMSEGIAIDSSGRDSAYRELSEMLPCASHHIPGQEIPERSRLYRLGKKYWFFGFGAYG